ncbi:MAG: hypothetical protein RL217_549 [Pseudomonadota bacterium]|jgi:HlyD family secretion protein
MPKLQRRTLWLIAALVPIALLFIYTVQSAGPIAPVKVTLTQVSERSISPALFGIGSIQARYTHKIGPTFAGRLKRVEVNVGDKVKAGQVLGEMDPVDLDERLQAQQAAIASANANVEQAQAKQEYAQTQAQRYVQLLPSKAVSEEAVATKQQELELANSALKAAQQERARIEAEYKAVRAQRTNLELLAPVDGLVIARQADAGTTVVAGQAVIELINPDSLWIDTRFDQISAEGLQAGLPAQVQLRSRRGQMLPAKVLRVEPVADVVTEEMLAKVVLDSVPTPLPPLGELAEITVTLPALPSTLSLSNAALVRHQNQTGVWRLSNNELQFVPVTLGRHDLDGQIQVLSGLKAGDQVVLYSEKPLSERSRVKVQAGLL